MFFKDDDLDISGIDANDADNLEEDDLDADNNQHQIDRINHEIVND